MPQPTASPRSLPIPGSGSASEEGEVTPRAAIEESSASTRRSSGSSAGSSMTASRSTVSRIPSGHAWRSCSRRPTAIRAGTPTRIASTSAVPTRPTCRSAAASTSASERRWRRLELETTFSELATHRARARRRRPAGPPADVPVPRLRPPRDRALEGGLGDRAADRGGRQHDIDLVAYADRLPNDGETLLGTDYRTGFGGKGANQAVSPRVSAHGSRWSTRSATTRTATRTSSSSPGKASTARTCGERRAHRASRRSGSTDGGRTGSSSCPGRTCRWTPTSPPRRSGACDRRSSSASSRSRRRRPRPGSGRARIGATTILNPAPAAPVEPALLAATDWLVPNETEFALVTGQPSPADGREEAEVIAATAARLGRSLVVTLGERGAAVAPVGNPSTLVRGAACRRGRCDRRG